MILILHRNCIINFTRIAFTNHLKEEQVDDQDPEMSSTPQTMSRIQIKRQKEHHTREPLLSLTIITNILILL